MKKIAAFFAFIAFLVSCGPHGQEDHTPGAQVEAASVEKVAPKPPDFVQKIQQAHALSAFAKHKAIRFQLLLNFGGKERLNAQVTLGTDSRKAVILKNNGHKIMVQDDIVKVSPDSLKPEDFRFDAYTWSYFFLFPYKLSDPGTFWSDPKEGILQGESYLASKLTFGKGVGDAPDDWYYVYQDPSTQLVHAAAYIVTANKSVEKAEESPHAIVYSNYEELDGVPLARTWTFYEWSATGGLGDEIGNATLSNVQFMD
jgi:hypothetical protein